MTVISLDWVAKGCQYCAPIALCSYAKPVKIRIILDFQEKTALKSLSPGIKQCETWSSKLLGFRKFSFSLWRPSVLLLLNL